MSLMEQICKNNVSRDTMALNLRTAFDFMFIILDDFDVPAISAMYM